MQRYTFDLVMVSLVVTLAIAISVCHAQPGIGTSHYNPQAVLTISEGGPYVIPVGHIRNVGTTTLNVTLTWTQETNGKTLNVELSPPWKLLTMDEGFEPSIIISGLSSEFVGNYSGSVEANCLIYPSEPEGGNPIVASSTLNVDIEVLLGDGVDIPGQNNPVEGVPLLLLIFCIVVGACNVVGFVYWRREKATKRNSKVESSEKGMWRVGWFWKVLPSLSFLICHMPSKLGSE